jgi:hypothetical protein
MPGFDFWSLVAKGPSRKRDDRDVNITERGDQKERGGHQYREKQFSD